MHGFKYDKNESQNDLVSKISECFSEISLPYEEVEVDRVHHIGKAYKNENSGFTMKFIIIKFKSWRYRQDVTIDQGDLKMTKRSQVKILLAFHWIWQSEGKIRSGNS